MVNKIGKYLENHCGHELKLNTDQPNYDYLPPCYTVLCKTVSQSVACLHNIHFVM